MNSAAFVIYLVALVVSPLLFGAVHSYAYTFMVLSVLAATVLLAIDSIKKDPKRKIFVTSTRK